MATSIATNATLTFGSGTWEIAEIPAAKGTECEAIEVTQFGDTRKRFVSSGVILDSEFSIKVYIGSTAPEAGTSGALSVSITTSNGSSTTGTASYSYTKVILTKVEPESVSADGDRKMMATLTFQPDGSTGSGN